MRDVSGGEPLAQTQHIRGHGSLALALLVALPLGVRSTGASRHAPLMHIESRAAFIDNVHQVPPCKQWTGDGMPSLGSNSPIRASQTGATDGGACGASGITLVVRLAARVSNRSLTWHPPCCHSTLFHA